MALIPNRFIFIPLLISFFFFQVACTRNTGKPAEVRIQLPKGGHSNYLKTVGALTGAGGWGVADPVDMDDVDCYGVLVEGPSPSGAVQTCINSSSDVVARPWIIKGAYPAGSVIELNVVSGPARKISLVAFNATALTDCKEFSSTNGPDQASLSAPQIVSTKTIDLNPGRTEIEMFASLSGAVKFEECTGMDFDDGGGGSPVNLFVADATTTEGYTANVTVSLSGVASSNVPVTLWADTSTSTAAYSQDYMSFSYSGTIASGSSQTTVQIVTQNDSTYESAENLVLVASLSGAVSGVSITDGTGILQIVDNDTAPSLYISNGTSLNEGSATNFVVSLSAVSGSDVTFHFETQSGTAISGADYGYQSSDLTITPGNLSISVPVSLNADGLYEGSNESFTGVLSSVSGATLMVSSASAQIVDMDSLPSIQIEDASGTEGDTLLFVVTLSLPSAIPLTVDFTPFGDSALFGPDFVASAGTLTVAPGDVSLTIPAMVIDDGEQEGVESFVISLSNYPSLVDNLGLGTITANDTPTIFVIPMQTGVESNTTIGFNCWVDTIPNSDVIFNFTTYSGTAIGGTDYVSNTEYITIPASSTITSFTVNLINDSTDEPDQFFTITLSTFTNAIAGSVTTSGTLFDDDGPPDLFNAASISAEDQPAVVQVSLSSVSDYPVTVDFQTLDQSALDGADYNQSSGTMTLSPGQVAGAITIATIDDTDIEASEVFKLTLTNANNANIVIPSSSATIADNDGWYSEAYLKAAVPGNNDFFGIAVGVDGETVLVGAKQEASNQAFITNGTGASYNDSMLYSGAGYVFKNNAGVWSQQSFIKAGDPMTSDYFGSLVSVKGDLAVISAPQEDSNVNTIVYGTTGSNNSAASSAGVVYVFRRSGSNWFQEAYLKPSNTLVNQFFGSSLAFTGQTLVVGALGESSSASGVINGTGTSIDTSTSGAGAAYVFSRDPVAGTWVQAAYLKAANPSLSGSFGASLGIDHDTIVVGATGEESSQTSIINGTGASTDTSSTDSGAAYVFKRTGLTWVQQAYLKASNSNANDLFGIAAAVHGDLIAISATSEQSSANTITMGTGSSLDNSFVSAGAVYIFKRSGANWTQDAYIKPPNMGSNLEFGSSLSLWGDTLAVGAEGESSAGTFIINGGGTNADTGASLSGAIYVFRRDNLPQWFLESYIKAPNAEANDGVGKAVWLSGDRLVTGAPSEDSATSGVINGTTASADNSMASTGAAYVFSRKGRLNVIVQRAEDQIANTAGAFPIRYRVEFSRPIDPSTFTPGDVVQSGGTATGITWSVTNTGDDRNFLLEATSGSVGTYKPAISFGSVQTMEGVVNEVSLLLFDNLVTY